MGITDRIEGVSLKKQIREGKYEFSSPHWDNISNEAKELVQRLLTVNPEDRASCDEALNDSWMRMNHEDMDMRLKALGKDVVDLIEEKSKTGNIPDTQTLESSMPNTQNSLL
ncbi:hypothetical protein G6F56_010432 [Rhizopus delemar]|nr:hypothetical protein G6F56_010432 [Rhizopus delemar]